MKVLHIISGDLWAGAEAQALTLIFALYSTPGIEISVVLLNDGVLARRLRSNGIHVYVLCEETLSSLQIFLRLRQHMRSFRPDIVHTHRIKENILGSLANRLATRAKSVRTVHGWNEHKAFGLRRLLLLLDVWCGRVFQNRVIAVSHELGQRLGRVFRTEQVIVIENGIDIVAVRGNVEPEQYRTSEPFSTHIGIVGRLVPVKRVDIFLEMAKILREGDDTRPWRFHVFGEGPLLAALSASCIRLALDGLVTFHGHRNDGASCIAALDVLVICSDHEGLPMTLLEALAVGTPVVAHAIGGITHVAGVCGGTSLVEDHSPNAYARSVLSTITLPKAGRTSIVSSGLMARYSASANAERTRTVYLSLLET